MQIRFIVMPIAISICLNLTRKTILLSNFAQNYFFIFFWLSFQSKFHTFFSNTKANRLIYPLKDQYGHITTILGLLFQMIQKMLKLYFPRGEHFAQESDAICPIRT